MLAQGPPASRRGAGVPLSAFFSKQLVALAANCSALRFSLSQSKVDVSAAVSMGRNGTVF